MLVLLTVVPALVLLWALWPEHINYFPDSLFCPEGHSLANASNRMYSEVGEDPLFDTRELCLSASGAVHDPGSWPVLWREGLLLSIPVIAWGAIVGATSSRSDARAGTTGRPAPADDPDPPGTSAQAGRSAPPRGTPSAHGRPSAPSSGHGATGAPGGTSRTADRWATGPQEDLWGRR